MEERRDLRFRRGFGFGVGADFQNSPSIRWCLLESLRWYLSVFMSGKKIWRQNQLLDAGPTVYESVEIDTCNEPYMYICLRWARICVLLGRYGPCY